VLLLCCSLQLAAIARHARRSRDRFTTAWRLLAIVFCYMSLDEVAQLHERLNSLVALRGVFYFGWIIPAGAIVLVVGVAYLRFIIRLPPVTRWRFIAAGVIYVGGALVMEMPLGMWATAHGEDNLGYVLIDGLEESLEMFGATLFLVALQCHRWALELSVTNAAQQRSAA
jgi:hypothetical protein